MPTRALGCRRYWKSWLLPPQLVIPYDWASPERRPTITPALRWAGSASASYPPRVFSGMLDPKTDRYSIEIKNLTTGETVILTSVDMTDHEKTVVVQQLLWLSGAPAALW